VVDAQFEAPQQRLGALQIELRSVLRPAAPSGRCHADRSPQGCAGC
jgi:hypothetical protein